MSLLAQLRSRAAATAVLTALVAALTPATARAQGVDSSLCSNNTDRVTIPGDFAVDACFDGEAIYLRNRTQFVLSVKTQGDVAKMRRQAPPMPTLESSYIATQTGEATIPPGYGLVAEVGANAADVRIGGDPTNSRYAWVRFVVSLLPTKSPGFYNTFAGFLADLDQAVANARHCFDNSSNFLSSGACSLGFMTAVFTACAGTLGDVAAEEPLLGGLIAFLETAKWSSDVVVDFTQFLKATRTLTIPAVRKPPEQPVQTTSQPPTSPSFVCLGGTPGPQCQSPSSGTISGSPAGSPVPSPTPASTLTFPPSPSGPSGSSGSPPAAPSNVHIDTFYGFLGWNDNSSDESGFHVYQNGNLVGDEPVNSTQFHGTLVGQCSDVIAVSAYNAVGESARVPSSGIPCPR
jgi:hypothetical protein